MKSKCAIQSQSSCACGGLTSAVSSNSSSLGWLPDFGTANKENHGKSEKLSYSTLCPILILEIFGEFGDGHIPAGPYDITTTIMQWNGMQKDTSTLAKENKKTCAQTCMSGSKEREP